MNNDRRIPVDVQEIIVQGQIFRIGNVPLNWLELSDENKKYWLDHVAFPLLHQNNIGTIEFYTRQEIYDWDIKEPRIIIYNQYQRNYVDYYIIPFNENIRIIF